VEDITAGTQEALVGGSNASRERGRGAVMGVDSGEGGRYAHDHLLAAQEWVADELAGAQGHLRFGHIGGSLGVLSRMRQVRRASVSSFKLPHGFQMASARLRM
jgi:hypothetical protein